MKTIKILSFSIMMMISSVGVSQETDTVYYMEDSTLYHLMDSIMGEWQKDEILRPTYKITGNDENLLGLLQYLFTDFNVKYVFANDEDLHGLWITGFSHGEDSIGNYKHSFREWINSIEPSDKYEIDYVKRPDWEGIWIYENGFEIRVISILWNMSEDGQTHVNIRGIDDSIYN